MTQRRKTAERDTPKKSDEPAKSRNAVLSDFRRIAGPLRGRNQALPAKP
jgi:hypothetical protein